MDSKDEDSQDDWAMQNLTMEKKMKKEHEQSNKGGVASGAILTTGARAVVMMGDVRPKAAEQVAN